MNGILLVSHHNLAKACIETLEMIAGNYNFLFDLGLEPGDVPEHFGEKILTKVESILSLGYKEVIIVVDLIGGTPFNQAVQLLKNDRVQVIVGMNMSMMLQLVISNNSECDVQSLVNDAVENGIRGILNARNLLKL